MFRRSTNSLPQGREPQRKPFFSLRLFYWFWEKSVRFAGRVVVFCWANVGTGCAISGGESHAYSFQLLFDPQHCDFHAVATRGFGSVEGVVGCLEQVSVGGVGLRGQGGAADAHRDHRMRVA
jgi:hypothetical protein